MKLSKKLVNFVSPSNIYESLKVQIWLLHFTGLMPFYMDSKNHHFHQSKIALSISTCYLILYVVCFGISFTNSQSLGIYFVETGFWEIVRIIFSIALILCVTIIALNSLIRRNSLKAIMILLLKLDKDMKSMSMRMNYNFVFWITCVSIAGLVPFQIVLNAITGVMFVDFLDLMYIIAFVLPPIYTGSFTLKFCSFAYVLKLCIREIDLVRTNHLEYIFLQNSKFQILKNFIDNDWKISSKRPTVRYVNAFKLNQNEAIEKLCILHENICDITDLIQQYFGIPLLTLLGLNSISLVIEVFYSVDMIFEPAYVSNTFETAVLTVIKIIVYHFHILILVESTHLVAEENAKIGDTLYVILNSEINSELKEIVRNFLMQWSNRRIVLTAAGIFTIDRTLLFTVGFWGF